VTDPLPVVASELAADQIRVAESWWRANRTKAPNAFREDLENASALLTIQPAIGARARNAKLAGVRRVHLSRVRYDLYYRVIKGPPKRVEILALWHSSRGTDPPV
jgi:hypothetical protein